MNEFKYIYILYKSFIRLIHSQSYKFLRVAKTLNISFCTWLVFMLSFISLSISGHYKHLVNRSWMASWVSSTSAEQEETWTLKTIKQELPSWWRTLVQMLSPPLPAWPEGLCCSSRWSSLGLLIISHHCSACAQPALSQHISAPPNTHKPHLIHPHRNTHSHANRGRNVFFPAHNMHTIEALRSVYAKQDLHLGGITLSRHLFQHTGAKLPICARVSSRWSGDLCQEFVPNVLYSFADPRFVSCAMDSLQYTVCIYNCCCWAGNQTLFI